MNTENYAAPQGRLLSTLSLFLLIVLGFYAVYLFLVQRSLNGDLQDQADRRSQIEAEMDALRSDQTEELFVAQGQKDLVEAQAVTWSRVLRALDDITPVTVFFNSYSTGSNGALQLSGLSDSYASTADLIRVLENSDEFVQVFVPSLTLGSTAEGQDVLSFSLNLNAQFDE